MGQGLGTIQDENDSNQDSDFQSDDEDKIPPIKENQLECSDEENVVVDDDGDPITATKVGSQGDTITKNDKDCKDEKIEKKKKKKAEGDTKKKKGNK